MAVITKIWLPETIGLECERPGMMVFQSTLCDFSTSQVIGGFVPSATPDAFGPRNDGQSCALVVIDERLRKITEMIRRFILISTPQTTSNSSSVLLSFFSLRSSAYLRDLCVETAVNAENAEVRREPQRTAEKNSLN